MPEPTRIPAYAIDPVFAARWSPRAFSGAAIELPELFALFEAARWAPSANNSQPWRFVFARRDTPHWDVFFALLNEGNQRWAANAAALVVLVSKTTHLRPGADAPTPLRNHSLDSGAAWLSLALQAEKQGWRTHAIGGFDRDGASKLLAIPDGYAVEIAIAIGKQATPDTLPEDLRLREQPTQRVPLEHIVAEGKFSFTV